MPTPAILTRIATPDRCFGSATLGGGALGPLLYGAPVEPQALAGLHVAARFPVEQRAIAVQGRGSRVISPRQYSRFYCSVYPRRVWSWRPAFEPRAPATRFLARVS